MKRFCKYFIIVVGIICGFALASHVALCFIKQTISPSYSQDEIFFITSKALDKFSDVVREQCEIIFLEDWSDVSDIGKNIYLSPSDELYEFTLALPGQLASSCHYIKEINDNPHPKRLEWKLGSRPDYLWLIIYPLCDDISDIKDIVWIDNHIGIKQY